VLLPKSTPAGGVDLPIVWVSLGTAADFQGKDVKKRCDPRRDRQG